MTDPDATDSDGRDRPSLEDELFDMSPDAPASHPPKRDVPVRERRAAPLPFPRPRLPRPRVPRPPWPAGEGPGCRDLAAGTMGFVTFIAVDFVMMYVPLRMKQPPSLMPQLVILLLLAFGLGAMLVWQVRGVWRPFGIGMMVAWVFLTLVSAGFLTGLNP